MGKIIDRVRNRQWCAENNREIAEIDERRQAWADTHHELAAKRLAARDALAAAILDEKRDTFHRIAADMAAKSRPFFAIEDVHALSALCFGGPLEGPRYVGDVTVDGGPI